MFTHPLDASPGANVEDTLNTIRRLESSYQFLCNEFNKSLFDVSQLHLDLRYTTEINATKPQPPKSPMATILHSPLTLLHHSIELIAHKLIAAFESPDRVQRILKALAENDFQVDVCDFTEDVISSISIPPTIHSEPYVEHLKTIFDRFLKVDAVERDGCILPECFPHRALLKTVINQHPGEPSSNKGAKSNTAMGTFKLPEDPFAHLGYYSFDMSTGMSIDTFTSAIASVGLALKGVDVVIDEGFPKAGVVFALTRPPGHHACHEMAGGYCYINNMAVAAEYMLSQLKSEAPSGTRSRVAILDLDFHHGNGTQSIFYNRREPAYISIHGEGEYPYYTGSVAERGSGEGEGYNHNFPLPARPNSTRDDYLSLLDSALDVLRGWEPEYVLISMGFDTFRKDALGGFELDVEDYQVIGQRIHALDLPVLVLLEGGYDEGLGELTVQFLRGLTGK